MTAGMFFLVAGALSLRLARWTWLTPDAADLVTGIFYGLAIGCLLVGMARGRRRRHMTVPTREDRR
ncbi:MAG TPA: hypothetical protein VFX78_03655 [Candidatus Eisenbacteria bacterium]|nr:hypothetical protein [Candidatus Eisenbacteria bacterium]